MVKKKKFISETRLRKDIDIIVNLAKKELLKYFGKDLFGVYFKGSASRKWDSPIDYVPGVSDIDLHVLVKNSKKYLELTSNLNETLKFSKKIEKKYFELNPKPSHIPLLQIIFVNQIKKSSSYTPPLKSTIKTIYGKDLPNYYNKKETKKEIKKRAKEQIISHKEILPKIIKGSLYRFEGSLVKYLNELSWRISSCTPNFISLNGVSYEESWSMNKTALFEKLKKLRYKKIANSYHDFYYYAYLYYVEKDSNDLRKSLVNGFNCLKMIIEKTQTF